MINLQSLIPVTTAQFVPLVSDTDPTHHATLFQLSKHQKFSLKSEKLDMFLNVSQMFVKFSFAALQYETCAIVLYSPLVGGKNKNIHDNNSKIFWLPNEGGQNIF